MRLHFVGIVFTFEIFLTSPALPQGIVSGRLHGERFPGSGEKVYFENIYCFASLDGPGSEARPFRTWGAEPVGWYRISGSSGNYTLAFSSPASFQRPVVLTNCFVRDGEKIDRSVTPQFYCADFHEGAWDEAPASHYYQTFVACGKGVTHVGFKLATDGVDGFGPGSQNLLVSIHRRGEGTPDAWAQVGPAASVLDVDCGGPKNYSYSAGWGSGEVPTTPGETYAVHLRAEDPAGAFQAFWRPDLVPKEDCYRIGAKGKTGFQGRHLWLAVAGDSDGLLIPYQKRVHKQFQEFAGFRSKWSQTYVAQGRSLASVILYAAVGGTQPQLSRQRAVVRLRRGGPGGPQIGIEKIAVGNGNYTGDASWGTFGLCYAPGEVPVEPGETYAVELESIENHETLHGFVNIKGQVSDERPGFNPYRKCPPDTYGPGTAFAGGSERMEFDLDMQIVEYEFATEGWAQAVEPGNLLENGPSGTPAAGRTEEGPSDAWKAFSLDPATTHARILEEPKREDRILRVAGDKKTADGGFVQKVSGLSPVETYRISGRVRCSWPVDVDRQCFVGHDPTGQVEDPRAPTIVWTTLPSLHGAFVPYGSGPIRPKEGSISVWLRGKTTVAAEIPFKADFADFALRRVRTSPPDGKSAGGHGGS